MLSLTLVAHGMPGLLVAVLLIALVSYLVHLLLGEPAGLIAFVVLLLVILLGGA